MFTWHCGWRKRGSFIFPFITLIFNAVNGLSVFKYYSHSLLAVTTFLPFSLAYCLFTDKRAFFSSSFNVLNVAFV